MWKATRDGVELVWDDGPKDWPPHYLELLLTTAADGETVAATPTGPFLKLNPADELSVTTWLEDEGWSLTGTFPEPPAIPDGAVA